MELKLDPKTFEKHQISLLREIIKSVKVKLVEAGVEGQQLEDATAHIAFSVASILDDTTGIESEGEEVRPYLTFRGSDDTLVHCGENAYSYEFAPTILDEVFGA